MPQVEVTVRLIMNVNDDLIVRYLEGDPEAATTFLNRLKWLVRTKSVRVDRVSRKITIPPPPDG